MELLREISGPASMPRGRGSRPARPQSALELQPRQAKWHLESKSTDSEDVEVDPEPVLSKDEMLKAES